MNKIICKACSRIMYEDDLEIRQEVVFYDDYNSHRINEYYCSFCGAEDAFEDVEDPDDELELYEKYDLCG